MAVLICTMGTLVVLLVTVVRQAKVRADTVAQRQAERRGAAAAAEGAEIERRRIEREDLQWRAEVLRESREKTAADLAEQRVQLAHIEDHTRRLQDDLNRLLMEKKTLDQLSQVRVLNHGSTQTELEELRRRLDQERDALAAAKSEAAQRPRSYAIIPYEGPNGTRRRPIYIECRGDQVILQPEGIVLSAGDFRGPLGPSNPLASSLRAIREYWARSHGASPGGEPYPLLIVRPDGAEAYGACREAMESWDDEFGYELVSDETNLAFPAADPALAAVLERTVREARRHQTAVAMAASARSAAERERPYLRATASRGGFVVEGAPPPNGGDDYEFGGPATGAPNGTSARDTHRQPAGGSATAYERQGRPGTATPGYSPPPLGGTHGMPAHGEHRAQAGQPLGGAASGVPAQPLAGRQGLPQTGARDGGGGGQAMARQPSSAGAPGGHVGSFGRCQGSCGPAPDEPLPDLAKTRGRNWALPHAARGATGVTRPVRILCSAHKLSIVPQQGSGQALRAIVLEGSTLAALDEFVSALWQHIEQWQMAGPGLYWKPELHVEVAPGGETRFEQLKHLLDGSGIQVRQKTR
jgi:hypothetical protein